VTWCCWCAVEEDGQDHFSRFHMRRRSKLPMPKVESDVSVWSLLCKNIGKDLSKISMPVSMNEPLNALQVCTVQKTCYLHPWNVNWDVVSSVCLSVCLSVYMYVCIYVCIEHSYIICMAIFNCQSRVKLKLMFLISTTTLQCQMSPVLINKGKLPFSISCNHVFQSQ